jgi:hypothetical protein
MSVSTPTILVAKRLFVSQQKHVDRVETLPTLVERALALNSPTLFDRVFSRVDASGDCWLWTGQIHPHGYGRFSVKAGLSVNAHAIVYGLLVGPPAKGLDLDHLCRNRACVNPDHLEPVERRTNLLRGIGTAARNKRKTHCPRGHAFAEHGYTYLSKKGYPARRCRVCFSAYCARLRERRMAA